MHAKSETITILENFVLNVKNQFGKSIKTIRLDNRA